VYVYRRAIVMDVRRLGCVVAAVLAVVGAGGGPAAADPGGGERAGHGAPASVSPSVVPAGKTYRVTLLTGDVVTVTGRGTGCPTVSVKPAAKSGTLTRHCGPDGHVTVVPSSAAPLVGAVLDPALFDVTALVLDGYDDARSADLPLIVRPATGLQRAAADPVTAGLAGKRNLPSIAAVAGRAAKAGGPQFLGSLTAAPATRSGAGSAGGVKVWLDRRVRASAVSTPARQTGERLDENLRQVSAPQAWAAGFTGKGTRVAVLDTGADFTHPDLVGRVVERADFTAPDGDAVDHYGHGTHVAATVAGSGAASAGARRGVAPDAGLVVGKVLDDDGYGTDSQVIAGMEWAAARADVVNMSLGGYEQSDGTDPMSQALDALTAQTGALFVVAAGNEGPADGTISSPAAAASALTVGAVDHTDAVAEFSSHGPVLTTRAAKPEIVAPGVDIVAARAAGTTLGLPIDDRYVTASGTSMATPHVAGAAALLAGRHPDWSPAQVKAALVGGADVASTGDKSTVAAARTTDAYTVGAGRLDAAAALDGVVAGQGIVNLGRTSETTLSWTNTGDSAARAALDVTVTDHNGRTAPARTAHLSVTQMSLPAGGSGSAGLTVDRAVAPGLYTALVTARSPVASSGDTSAAAGGAVLTRTPVTFVVDPPSHDLTVVTAPLPGIPANRTYVSVHVVNLDDPAVFSTDLYPSVGETVPVPVPAGRYSVMASYGSYTGNQADDKAALVGDPDVAVGAATTVSLEPGKAQQVKATVDGVDTEAAAVGVTMLQTARRGPGWDDFAFAWGQAARNWNVYVAPNDGARAGRFRVVASFGLPAPGSFYDVLHTWEAIPADPTYRVTAAERARMGRIDHRFHRIGTPTVHKRYALSPEGAYIAEGWTDDVPETRTDYVTPGFLWKDEAFYADGLVTQQAFRQVEPGSRVAYTWARQPLRSDWFDDPAVSLSGCTPLAPTRTRGTILVELVTLTDRHQRFDCLSGWPLPGMTRSLSLYRNGSLVGSTLENWGEFDVPAGPGDFRLAFDVEPGPTVGTPARISSQWTFRSAGPTGTGTQPLPLLSVDYDLPLDTANHPVAGRPATFEVRQAHGVSAQRITSFQLWTSTDDGKTWQPATVGPAGDGRYGADLPTLSAGQAMSLRVSAAGSAGSRIDQTIVAAYRA
jgi:subtilisin family serine protease